MKISVFAVYRLRRLKLVLNLITKENSLNTLSQHDWKIVQRSKLILLSSQL